MTENLAQGLIYQPKIIIEIIFMDYKNKKIFIYYKTMHKLQLKFVFIIKCYLYIILKYLGRFIQVIV